MVKCSNELRSLTLAFPSCCGIGEFALSGTYPHLRSFSMDSIVLQDTVNSGDLPTRTFLTRHPSLVHLCLTYFEDPAWLEWNGYFELRHGDLPNLRALNIDEATLEITPTFTPMLSACKLEALGLEFMPRADWRPLVSSFASLKYLYIATSRWYWSRDVHEVPPQDATATEGQDGVAPPTSTDDGDDASSHLSDESRDDWSSNLRAGEDPKAVLVSILTSIPNLTEFRFGIRSSERLSDADLVRTCRVTMSHCPYLMTDLSCLATGRFPGPHISRHHSIAHRCHIC